MRPRPLRHSGRRQNQPKTTVPRFDGNESQPADARRVRVGRVGVVMTYYNDNDQAACAWLRELQAAGLITDGVVDDRSIADVRGSDLAEFERVHLFAGIGGFDYALRLAKWAAGVSVWTGSPPCQPFSCAGKGAGEKDPRHLWPEFRRLIAECHPAIVFGEQVASKAGRQWLAGVFTDMEALGYACAGADLCAAGVGSPHIRQRLYWVAISQGGGNYGALFTSKRKTLSKSLGPSGPGGLCNPAGGGAVSTEQPGQLRGTIETGFWSDYDVIPFRDGKVRRTQPRSAPLVIGLPRGVVPCSDPRIEDVNQSAEARAMRLKGYGNSICAPLAAVFIKAVMDWLETVEATA